MRLTALYVSGTLLAFLSLSWITVDSDEGNLLEQSGFGPCAITLRPEGPCRQGQDESTCPYLISMPPLNVHFPKELRELETLVKDLQMLKDNVDQLRKMCADCTVRQTERECGRENEELNVATDRKEDERSWNRESLNDFSQGCGTNRVKAENVLDGNSDTDPEKRTVSEEKGKKKWEAESDKGMIKEGKKLQQVGEKDGKSQIGRAKGKDKLRPAIVPTPGGTERILDMAIKKVAEKSKREREGDTNRGKNGRGNLEGNREDTLVNGKEKKITKDTENLKKTEERDHRAWRDETKEAEFKTQTKEDGGSDGIKMSERYDGHTDKKEEQHREERKKEMEKAAKMEQNNRKPKQTESTSSIETEKTIKEGEEENQTGKEIQTEGEQMVQSVQRDSDGELESGKATEKADFVPISPTPHSTITLSPRHDSVDSNEAVTFASSLGSLLPSTTLLLITGVNHGMTTSPDRLQTESTGLRAGGISKHPSPDVEAGFRTTSRPTTTTSTLVSPRQQISSFTTRFISTSSTRPGTSIQKQINPTMATATTTVPDRSSSTAKKNMSSNTKMGTKHLPGRGPVSSEKHKPAVRPGAALRPENRKNKPDRTPLLDKRIKHDQKQRSFNHKPVNNPKPKPGKDLKQVQIPKRDQSPPHDSLTTDRNLKNTQIPKHDQGPADQNQSAIQKLNSSQKSFFPVKTSASNERPQSVNATDSVRDPSTDRESAEIPVNNQNRKPGKKLGHALQTDKPGQKQEPHTKMKSEDKPTPDQSSAMNQYFTPTQEPELEKFKTTSLTPNPFQRPETEYMERSDENLSPEPKSVPDSSPEQRLTPDHSPIKLPQKPKPSQIIPKRNTKPGTGPTKLNLNNLNLTTGQNINVMPKPDQTPHTNQRIKTPLPNRTPNLPSKSEPNETPETESSKTSASLPRHRTPTRPTVEPGVMSAQRPKPPMQLKPSPNTKTDLGPPQITMTASDSIQSIQTDTPPASGPVKTIGAVTPSPGKTEFSSSEMISLDLKTFGSLENRPLPHLHTLPDDFTMSPNSRIMSDPRPQTATQPPSIQMTTTPNRIVLGSVPSVILSTSPGPTKPRQVSTMDSGSQVHLHHNVEGPTHSQTPEPEKMTTPVSSPSAQMTSTTSPDLRSTNPASSGPGLLAPEVSTASTRELRVKINQVAAFFNNSLSPNGRHPDRHPNEHLENKQGGSRPDRTDSKLPTQIPFKGKSITLTTFNQVFVFICTL